MVQVIIDCLGVGLLKPKDEIVSMHVTQEGVKRRKHIRIFCTLSHYFELNPPKIFELSNNELRMKDDTWFPSANGRQRRSG